MMLEFYEPVNLLSSDTTKDWSAQFTFQFPQWSLEFYYARRLKEFLKWKRALFNTMFSFSFDQNRPVTILDNIQNENWNATSLPATTNRHEQLLLYILFLYRPQWNEYFRAAIFRATKDTSINITNIVLFRYMKYFFFFFFPFSIIEHKFLPKKKKKNK